MPSTPRTPLARGQKGSGSDLQAADGCFDKPMSLRLGHTLQALDDEEGSIAQCPLRGLVGDRRLLAR